MKIGLIDGDNTAFPNLALMKISAYHKRHGDTVEFVNYWDSYDKVYISKVFTYTSDHLKGNVIMCDEIVAGGTGYNLTSKLPEDMEYIYPDYDLYPGYDFALGFLSRGCP
ncbi:MAG: radical SAM protein, partial [Candidatus Riflebacteria bacterium]